MAKAKKKQVLNGNNPFHLMIILITTVFKLIASILSGIYKLLFMIVKHWVASLLILAAVFVMMYTFGVI